MNIFKLLRAFSILPKIEHSHNTNSANIIVINNSETLINDCDPISLISHIFLLIVSSSLWFKVPK